VEKGDSKTPKEEKLIIILLGSIGTNYIRYIV